MLNLRKDELRLNSLSGSIADSKFHPSSVKKASARKHCRHCGRR